MSADSLLAAWAPDGARWTRWCKPVLFSFMDDLPEERWFAPVEPELDLERLLPAEAPGAEAAEHPYRAGPAVASRAWIIDLPGRIAIGWGLALAREGFRPVPLFNSMPGPPGRMPAPLEHVLVSLVDVVPILERLAGGARLLAQIELHPDAAPAFLLDAGRDDGHGPVVEGRYDNRALSLPADFPSGAALAQAGLRDVGVVCVGGRVAWDLVDTLHGWQKAGLSVAAVDVASGASRAWRKPLWRPLAAMARRLVLAGFHGGHVAGPFGDRVPPSGG